MVYVTATKLGSSYYYMVIYADITKYSDSSDAKTRISNFMPATRAVSQNDSETLKQLTKSFGDKIVNTSR